jgi:predicted aldo/keto reductase-like oxidoreductase
VIGRREFLRHGAAAGVGLCLPPAIADAVASGGAPRVRRRVRLGRTGLEIPDIGFGGSRLSGDEALVRHALERGVTYFDTAEGYTGGDAETTLRKALECARYRVTIATKVQASATATRAEMMAALEGSLRRLRTDHVDVYFLHAVNAVERIANPEWPEFVAAAKRQGKIRWSGMSGHGGRLVACVDHALDHDLVDVLLLGYNFGQDPSFTQRFTEGFDFVAVQPDLPRVMRKARKQDVGVIAMKTLRGARLNDMRPYEAGGATFAQAAFRWVLSGDYADALVVTMKSPEMVDEYLVASGSGSSTRRDGALLTAYERSQGGVQCRYGCDGCLDACPEGVQIAEVLRTRMYAEDYADVPLALGDYDALGDGAAACVGCAHQRCADACPYGLPIPELTVRTHRRLGAAGGAS